MIERKHSSGTRRRAGKDEKRGVESRSPHTSLLASLAICLIPLIDQNTSLFHQLDLLLIVSLEIDAGDRHR